MVPREPPSADPSREFSHPPVQWRHSGIDVFLSPGYPSRVARFFSSFSPPPSPTGMDVSLPGVSIARFPTLAVQVKCSGRTQIFFVCLPTFFPTNLPPGGITPRASCPLPPSRRCQITGTSSPAAQVRPSRRGGIMSSSKGPNLE